MNGCRPAPCPLAAGASGPGGDSSATGTSTPATSPRGVNYVIPTVEGLGLSGTYGYGYSEYDGSPTSVTYPAGGGLVAETAIILYDRTTGLSVELEANAINVANYVAGQIYTEYGEPSITTRKIAGGVYVEDATYYDPRSRGG